MRRFFEQLLAVGPELAAFILTAPLLQSHGVLALSTTAVSSPDLDFSGLGRVALAGDFESISLYTYEGQASTLPSDNGSQSLLARYPDGEFASVAQADATILAMCPFVLSDGSFQGVVVGGNFTSLDNTEAQSIALFNPNTSTVTPLPGLSGVVNTVYCDQNTSTVYVGGNFIGANSSNAIAWTTGWTNLPFAGFNGPVYSITKNTEGNVVFAGQFDGLGNVTSPQNPDGQVVNLGASYVAAQGTAPTAGYNDSTNIICKTGSQQGPGNSWLLADYTGGWWEAELGFGIVPTKLRLYNTNIDGRGSKTFYFESLNSGGILNLTYADANGKEQWCVNSCPLTQNITDAQDFYFVASTVGMNSFRLYITDWYGPGAGLDGIELFQDEIYSYAINSFNEPMCDGVSNASHSLVNPNSTWTYTKADLSKTNSNYLTADLTDASQISPSTSVIFQPNIEQSGNYSVKIFTPGCIQDNTCSVRGQVNITASVTTHGDPVTTSIYQSNDYDKYDQVYYGYVDATADSFRPSVTLTPLAGQSVPLLIVAQSVQFELVATTGGLNGLYEYNPSDLVLSDDFSNSTVDVAGASLNAGAIVNTVAVNNGQLYAAGNFSGNGISNVMKVDENATALSGGGLNARVVAMFSNGSTLYFGGDFSDTATTHTDGLSHLAMYSTSSNSWSAVGAGVNGVVSAIVPLQLNLTDGQTEDCISVTGRFTSVNAFNGNASFSTDGFAVWVPGMQNWLQNLPNNYVGLDGDLTAATTVPGYSSLYGGSISSQGFTYDEAVELVSSSSGSLGFEDFGIKFTTVSQSNASSTNKVRRATSNIASQNYTGVYDGLFYDSNGLNITVLGGAFSATATNGSTIENLAFINNTNSQTVSGVSGLDADSIFMAMDTQGTLLFAGGAISGTVNGNSAAGVIVYDLSANVYASPQPPPLSGPSGFAVEVIAAQPDSSAVFVGGSFENAGQLPCASLCYYDTSSKSWNSPGSGLSGTVYTMMWTSDTQLIIAGNLTVNGNATTMGTYDSKSQTYSAYTGASSLPGPINAMSAVSSAYDEFWVGGVATANQSAYLSKFSSNTWTGVSGLGAGSVIRGLQVLSLTSDHASSSLVASDETLMVTGLLTMTGTGNASAVLFNGTTFTPLMITSTGNSSNEGSLSKIFVSNPNNFFQSNTHHLALGLVVLIGLAIALGLIFLLVVAGILLERYRRRKEGYVPMGSDKSADNLNRIPPQNLFAGLGEPGAAPKI